MLQGQWLALAGNQVSAASDDLLAALLAAIERMGPEASELLTCYYGADVTEDEARTLADRIHAQYRSLEVEVIYGGQPHYPYLLTLE